MKRVICLLAAAAALAWGQEKQSEPPNVELTVYLLSGLQTSAGDDVPQDLATTVKQLHNLFSYKGYKLADSFLLRGRSSTGPQSQSAETGGVLPGAAGLHYSLRYRNVRVSLEKPHMVHIDGLQFSLSMPPTYGPDGKPRYHDSVASISTDLDLVDGQKTVVGKSSINTAGDALILVIVPKVIE